MCVCIAITQHIHIHCTNSLDAVEELMGELSPEADGARVLLKRMPDLERQLMRHHALGSVHRRYGWKYGRVCVCTY